MPLYLPYHFHVWGSTRVYTVKITFLISVRKHVQYRTNDTLAPASARPTMNDYMFAHQNDDDNEIAKCKELFNKTIDIIKQV